MTTEVGYKQSVVTINDADDGVNHTTGWVAIKTPAKVYWFNKDKVVHYTVEEEKG